MANTNEGVAPPDPTTDVGKFRLLSGDTQYTALDPAQFGKGNYAYFSDDEAQAFLDLAGDSTQRAVGYAYLQLAAEYGIHGRSVKTDDLNLVTTGRSGDLRLVAAELFAQANAADENEAADIFEIVDFPTDGNKYCPPEGQPHTVI